jgi:hypothetical protein
MLREGATLAPPAVGMFVQQPFAVATQCSRRSGGAILRMRRQTCHEGIIISAGTTQCYSWRWLGGWLEQAMGPCRQVRLRQDANSDLHRSMCAQLPITEIRSAVTAAVLPVSC